MSKQPFTRTTPIWIYDRDEKLRLILDPKGDIPHYDSWYIEQLNGAISLEFTVPANHPDVAFIENDGRAVIRDQDGNLIEFIIREPIDSNDNYGAIKQVYAEGGDYELIDEWVTGYKADNVTLKTALEAVLSSTRWSVGNIDDFGTQSVDIKPTTAKNAVYQLTELFGGERRYRVTSEENNNRITHRYMDVLKRRGQTNGKRFEHGKDTKSTRRTIDSTGVKTALYGYGASGENDAPRLTFADVSWAKANGDPADKPLGQTWIGDEKALQKWGYDQGKRHRFGEYSGQEEDAAELLLNTWNYLQTINDVVTTYDFEVALLEKMEGYEHEKVRLGDTVLGIDREIQPNINVEASIIEYRQNLNDDSLDEVTLGQFRKAFDSASRVRDVEQVVDRDRGNWDKKETPQGAQTKVDEAISPVQLEIDDAKLRLNDAETNITNAKLRLDTAETDISTAKTDITNAQNLIDSVTDKDAAGVTVLSGTLVTNKIVAESAVLTGTITSSNAKIIDLTTENLTAIGGTFQNVIITGTLDGVDGRFTGQLDGVNGTFIGDLVGGSVSSNTTIDVTTNLNVGNLINLNRQGTASESQSGVVFYDGLGVIGSVRPDYDTSSLSISGFNGVNVYPNLYVDGREVLDTGDFGTGYSNVARGDHSHSEYASSTHTHSSFDSLYYSNYYWYSSLPSVNGGTIVYGYTSSLGTGLYLRANNAWHKINTTQA